MQPNISRRSATSLLCGVLVLAVCTTAVARSGNSTSGPGTERNTPGAVKNLLNVRNIDGGNEFTLVATTE